jgi:hypothetical protein
VGCYFVTVELAEIWFSWEMSRVDVEGRMAWILDDAWY